MLLVFALTKTQIQVTKDQNETLSIFFFIKTNAIKMLVISILKNQAENFCLPK